MDIREERPDDIGTIRKITSAAFQPMEYSTRTEAAIIDALRGAGALHVSLVAVADGDIVGHVAFSPVTIDGAHRGWYGLGPVSVRPDRQKEGIGGVLIRAGLERLSQAGAKGCVLVGDPGYYRRFGFEADPGLRFEGAPAVYFLKLTLDGATPAGSVSFHVGFDAT